MIDKLKKLFSPKASPLTRKWLLSYILILIIPLITNSISQIYSYTKLKEELLHSNTNLVAQMNSDLDRLLSSAQRMALNVARMDSVKNLFWLDTQGQVTTQEMFRTTIEIGNGNGNEEIAGEYFLYLPQSKLIVGASTATTLEDCYQLRGVQTDFAVWQQQIINGSGWQSYATNGGGEFCFVNQLQDGGAVIAVVTPGNLSAVVNANADHSGIYVYDQNNDNYVFLGAVPVEQMLEGKEFIESYGAVQTSTFTTVYRKMNYTSFYLAYTMSNHVFWGQIYSVIFSFLLSVLLCLVIGFAASYYFSKKNIKPFEQIASLFDETDSGERLKQNDYQSIYRAVADAVESRKDTLRQLEKQNSVLLEMQLRKLLNGQVESFLADQESFQKQILFQSDYFLVCLLYVEDFEESNLQQEESFQKIYDIIVEIIAQSLTDALDQYDIVYVLQENGVATVILNQLMGQKQTKTQLQTLLWNFSETLYEKYHITLSIYVGDWQTSLYGIGSSYQHALTTMEKGVLVSKEAITWYEDICENEVTQYYYPLDKEHFMASALKEGNLVEASEIFEQIWQANFAGGTDNPYGKWIINNLVNLLIKTALDLEAKNQEPFAAALHLDRIASSGQHPTIIHDRLSNAIDRICNVAKSFEKVEGDVSISEKVSEYIMEHYQDQNLSINLLGETFQLTPHYLSKLFKEQTGKTLLDFIHSVRLDHAKELLSKREKNMEEIAIQVGYTNRVTFTRAFKKYCGITPGKYLETL